MQQDQGVRQEAHGVLQGLFSRLGGQGGGGGQGSGGGGGGDVLGGMAGQLEEFVAMPMELTKIFLDMSVQLTDLVLTSLEEAGIVLVKGLTPA